MKKKRKDKMMQRDLEFHNQFRKTKTAMKPYLSKKDTSEPISTNALRPLMSDFKGLQERALLTPMLDDNIDALDLDIVLQRHTKVIGDYSPSYLLGITVLCLLRERRYFWYVQTVIVSKATGKNVGIGLLSKRQKEDMLKGMMHATSGVGDFDKKKEIKIKDGRVWEIPFMIEDYELLLKPFRDLTDVQSCENCGTTRKPYGAFSETPNGRIACSPECFEILEKKDEDFDNDQEAQNAPLR